MKPFLIWEETDPESVNLNQIPRSLHPVSPGHLGGISGFTPPLAG